MGLSMRGVTADMDQTKQEFNQVGADEAFISS
jgi:hypothetical protein